MKSITYLFCICLLFFTSTTLFAQASQNRNHTFYIVRHAEKDTGSNPAISAQGMKRAQDLYRVLKNKKIDLIMVSQYRRTGMTGDSMRIYKNIDTLHYMADADGTLLFKKINSLAGNFKNILIIGHSNTLPSIIRKAGVQSFTPKEIPDHEYDNLFIVKVKNDKAVLKSKKYGPASVIPVNSAKMNPLQ